MKRFTFAMIALIGLFCAGRAQAQVFEGDLFYTLFTNALEQNIEEDLAEALAGSGLTADVAAIPQVVNVKKFHYSWDGATLTIGTPEGVAMTPGADGIIFDPGGQHVILGGQDNVVYRAPIDGSAIAGANVESAALSANTGSFHLTADPDGTKFWTSEQPDNVLNNVTYNFGSTINQIPVTGDMVTQIGFAPTLSAVNPNLAYYTNSDVSGLGGNFGIVNLSTGVASPAAGFTGIDGPHSVQYDPHSGDVFLFGDQTIIQVDITDPTAPTIKSMRDLSAELGAKSEILDVTVTVNNVPFIGTFGPDALVNIIASMRTFGFNDEADQIERFAQLARMDQGIVDGQGHLFAAVNTGHLVFLDYTDTGLIENAILALDQTQMLPFLDENLDDLAPLVGAGSVPGPSSWVAVITGVALLRRRRAA